MERKMLIVPIPLKMLEPHPDNPRKDLGDLTELAESIKANGIMQNLTVVASPDPDLFRVVIGHRRMAAAKLAGLTEVPCVISDMDIKEQIATMLAENMQRSDLTPYEQAWGFQQMSMLGCTVEEIADKSGFSQTTVRRRLKMAELDAEVLQEVTSDERRQITIGDFDRLAEIEDVELRNKALTAIGTNNFDWKLQRAKKEELANKRRPAVLKWLKEHGAQEIMQADAGSRKYESLRGKGSNQYWGSIWLDDDKAPRLPKDKEVEGISITYVMKETSVNLYMPAERYTAAGKKSREVLDREKLARETKKQIREISAVHYELRKAFVENLGASKQNRERILLGAVYIALYRAHGCGGVHSAAVTEALCLESYEHKTSPIIQGIGKITMPTETKKLAGAIYALYNDGPENWFAKYMETPGTLPDFDNGNHNTELMILYQWLMSLGYEPCDEEQQMMDGTHAVYHAGGKK